MTGVWWVPAFDGDDGGYVRFHAPHLGSGLRRKDGLGGSGKMGDSRGARSPVDGVTFLSGL